VAVEHSDRVVAESELTGRLSALRVAGVVVGDFELLDD
jgi:hypothetical protein